jgi:hypothetical protein
MAKLNGAQQQTPFAEPYSPWRADNALRWAASRSSGGSDKILACLQARSSRTMAAFRLDMPPPTLDLAVASGEPAVLA